MTSSYGHATSSYGLRQTLESTKSVTRLEAMEELNGNMPLVSILAALDDGLLLRPHHWNALLRALNGRVGIATLLPTDADINDVSLAHEAYDAAHAFVEAYVVYRDKKTPLPSPLITKEKEEEKESFDEMLQRIAGVVSGL